MATPRDEEGETRLRNGKYPYNGSLLVLLAIIFLYLSFIMVLIPIFMLFFTKKGRRKLHEFFNRNKDEELPEAQSTQYPHALSTLERAQSFRNRRLSLPEEEPLPTPEPLDTLLYGDGSSERPVNAPGAVLPPNSLISVGAPIAESMDSSRQLHMDGVHISSANDDFTQGTQRQTAWEAGNGPENRMARYDMVDIRNEVTGQIPVNPLETTRREDDVLAGIRPTAGVESLQADHVVRGRDFSGNMERETEDIGRSDRSVHLSAVASQSFEVKQRWFHGQLRDMRIPFEEGIVELDVSREKLLEDAFRKFSRIQPRDLHRIMRVTFVGEPAQDAGGPLKEFLNTIVKDVVCGDWGMFRTALGGANVRNRERESDSPDDHSETGYEEQGRNNVYTGSGLCYQIDPLGPAVQPDCMEYFEFLGKVLGKALWEHIPIDAHFTRTLYKHVLDSPIELEDLAAIDPNILNSLTYILSNDVTDLCLGTFTVTYDSFGDKQEIPLVENGENVEITEENKEEYVDLYLKWLTTGRVASQIEHLKGGLLSVIPRSLLSVFSCQELELLMCGMPIIDVDEWERYTMYTGEYYRGHSIIEWFWKAVRSFTPEQRAKLLQFATGTSRLPASGFSGLEGSAGNLRRFCVTSVALSVSEWPRAHTCFNRIDLPLYDNAQILEERLRIAVEVESVGFGMV